jgi:hypothetical protein
VRVSRHVVAGGLVAALVVHFGFTLLYLMPANPIGLRVRPVVSGYVDPFFTQNWALFAPDPIVDTRELLVSCRHPDGRGGSTDTPWANITTPLRDKRAEYRVGPSNAIERAQMGPLHLVLAPGDPLIERLARDKAKEFAALIDEYEQERKQNAERGHRLLRRVASAACDRLVGRGAATQVAMRMLVTPSPPFSRRAEPMSASETRYVDFPWGPYESVALF